MHSVFVAEHVTDGIFAAHVIPNSEALFASIPDHFFDAWYAAIAEYSLKREVPRPGSRSGDFCTGGG